ncbi:MAG: fatty acid-binding protein-like protein [Jatrophihabitantaceae bacterium]|nr:fatty acid-binding protein-like protein [Jatrophihabitantaceae bacterium]
MWGGLPIPDDSVDLRSGPELSARLLALLPLVGQWSGTGRLADSSTGESVAIGLALAFAHDGRDFLTYESRSWLVPVDAADAAPPLRESGFWRRGFNQDAVEVTLADSAGAITVLTGVAGDARWELATDSVASAPTGRAVRAERRLYAVVRDALMVVSEQKVDDVWVPRLNVQLFRTR